LRWAFQFYWRIMNKTILLGATVFGILIPYFEKTMNFEQYSQYAFKHFSGTTLKLILSYYWEILLFIAFLIVSFISVLIMFLSLKLSQKEESFKTFIIINKYSTWSEIKLVITLFLSGALFNIMFHLPVYFVSIFQILTLFLMCEFKIFGIYLKKRTKPLKF